MEGIKKLLLIGIGAFALMQLIKPHAVSAQEQVELPRSQVELPRSAQLLDIATVPAYSQARINVNCPFEKCEVLDNGSVVETLLKGQTWSKCFYENAVYGFSNCCESGSVRSADGERVIGCIGDRMIQNTGVQNITHLYQVREVL